MDRKIELHSEAREMKSEGGPTGGTSWMVLRWLRVNKEER